LLTLSSSQFDPTRTFDLIIVCGWLGHLSLADCAEHFRGGIHATARVHRSHRRRSGVAAPGGAQQSSKMKRCATISPATKIGDMSVSGYRILPRFFEELSRLGYVEGENLMVERYSGEGRTERYADLARDVVSTHPNP